jgi:hypothetical protein
MNIVRTISFTAAKFDDGKIRVDVFEDHDIAAMNYHLMRSIGGPRRIILGRGMPGDTREEIAGKVARLIAKAEGNLSTLPRRPVSSLSRT